MKTNKKKRIGHQIVDSLQEFVGTLQAGADIEREFTCHRVEVTVRPSDHDAGTVKQTRKTLNASQAVFARFLGVSIQTVRAWEQGENVPSGMAKRFLDEIRHNPDYWRRRLHEVMIPKKRPETSKSK